MAVEVEVVVDRGVGRSKLLQRLKVPKSGHGPFSSSEWLMRILSPVVEPAAVFLIGRIPDFLHRRPV